MFSSLAASLTALLSLGQLTLPTPTPAQPSTPVHPGPTATPTTQGQVHPGPVIGHPAPPPGQPGVKVGAAAPSAVAPPAQQMAEAKKMASLFTQAQQTLQPLQAAEQKYQPQANGKTPLALGERAQLGSAIASAINSLKQIRSSVPYDDLQQQLYQTSSQLTGKTKLPATAMQPLASAVQANKIYLQPQLVSNVSQAQQALQAGDDQRAALELKDASDALYSDIGLRPIDDALSSLTAAQQALQKNDTAGALQQLHGANQISEKLKLEAPLVPVRFELRAAADAANNHQHHHAQTLVQNAGDELRHLRGTIGTWQLRAQLDPMIVKVADLRRQLDAGQTPSGSNIANVAQQATAFQYNESFRTKK